MGFFALAMAYSYSFFFILQSILGLDEGGMGLKIYSVIMTFFCIFIYIRDVLRKKELRVNDLKYIWAIVLITILFYWTSVKFGGANERYKGLFLSFGVRCIPSLLVALLLAKYDNYIDKMIKALPVFMFMYTLAVLLAVLNKSDSKYVKELFDTGGMNYQNVSYYSCYAFLMNYLIIGLHGKVKFPGVFNNVVAKIFFVALLPVQVYCMLSGGGRGALVLFFIGVLILTFFCFGDRFKRVETYVYLIIIGVIVVIVYRYLINSEGLSTGIRRLTNFFTDANAIKTDVRNDLREDAILLWGASPIFGWGMGSVFYVFEVYSHNMVSDMLMETGIVGTMIMVICMIISLKTMFKLISRDSKYVIIALVLICSIVMLQFSNYYLSDSGLWFALFYFMAKNDIQKREAWMNSLTGESTAPIVGDKKS